MPRSLVSKAHPKPTGVTINVRNQVFRVLIEDLTVFAAIFKTPSEVGQGGDVIEEKIAVVSVYW